MTSRGRKGGLHLHRLAFMSTHPRTAHTHVYIHVCLCVWKPSHSTSVCSSKHVFMRQGAQPTAIPDTAAVSKPLPLLFRNREGTVCWASVPFTSPHGLPASLRALLTPDPLWPYPGHIPPYSPSSHPLQPLLKPLLQTCPRGQVCKMMVPNSKPICGEANELGDISWWSGLGCCGARVCLEGPGPRAGLQILQNGSPLAPLSSHFPRALKIGLFRLSGTFGEAGLLHKLAFFTCLGLPCFAASPGTLGTQAVFKPFPICTSWALWSRVASLASLEVQSLHYPSPQVQQTFPLTKCFHQPSFHFLLTVTLGVAIVNSISERKTKTQSLCGLLCHLQTHCEVRSQIPQPLTPSHSLIEAEGRVINVFWVLFYVPGALRVSFL